MKAVTLTQQQRRVIVEHFAEQCARDFPADASLMEEARHLKAWWLRLSLALDARTINENHWEILMDYMLDCQSFDRDPAGWLHAEGIDYTAAERESWRDHFNDMISGHINVVAG